MVLQNRINLNDHNTHKLEHTIKSFIPIREPVDILKLASKVANPVGTLASVVIDKFKSNPSSQMKHSVKPASALNIPSRQRNPNLK